MALLINHKENYTVFLIEDVMHTELEKDTANSIVGPVKFRNARFATVVEHGAAAVAAINESTILGTAYSNFPRAILTHAAPTVEFDVSTPPVKHSLTPKPPVGAAKG